MEFFLADNFSGKNEITKQRSLSDTSFYSSYASLQLLFDLGGSIFRYCFGDLTTVLQQGLCRWLVDFRTPVLLAHGQLRKPSGW